jgi:hypothetical protein
LDSFQTSPFLIGALTGSVPSYLLGLLVGWLRRERLLLGFAITSSHAVKKGLQNLHAIYDRMPVSGLDSHEIVLQNIGNRPLTHLPVRIQSEPGSKIVAVEIQPPHGAAPAHESSNDCTAIVKIDLLNPRESLIVRLTVANASALTLAVTARAENLSVRRIPQPPGD